jgi:cell division protein FtsZ
MIETIDTKPLIKVIGVGGGGGNAANYMFSKGIKDVDFVVCNTDNKALIQSAIPNKIMIGEKGLGAGNKPEIGRQAAIESQVEIDKILDEGTEMVFVTAGMGGGTGTGAAPVIAKAAKKKGILTIGIVTIPFVFEGRNRLKQAIEGLEEMRKSVDAIIIITNERIKQMYGDLSLSNAFSKADDVLATAAKGIAELITIPGFVNVDLNDVRTVLTNSGDAIMGSAIANGENRALDVIQEALKSPLLINCAINTSDNVLLNIASGIGENEVKMDELGEITNYLQNQLKPGAQIIWGNTYNESLGDNLQVTIVVTGLKIDDKTLEETKKREEPKKPGIINSIFGPTPAPKQERSQDEMVKLSDEDAGKLAQKLYGANVLTDPNAVKTGNTARTEPETRRTATPATAEKMAPVEEKKKVQEPAPKKFNLEDFNDEDLLDKMERDVNYNKDDKSDPNITNIRLEE